MELIDQHVESLIFTSGQPITEKEISSSLHKAIDENISEADVDASLQRLVEKYKSEEYAFEIVPISRGYHFMTKGAYHNTVGEHLKIISKKKLSRAALETLAIIAYKQPVTRIDLEAIRGVGCDYTIQKLMEKELVEMQGRSAGPGRPLLYGTSEKFMDYFGIKDLKDLPKPKDFEMPETEVGEPAPIEVVVPNESNEESTNELEIENAAEDVVNEETRVESHDELEKDQETELATDKNSHVEDKIELNEELKQDITVDEVNNDSVESLVGTNEEEEQNIEIEMEGESIEALDVVAETTEQVDLESDVIAIEAEQQEGGQEDAVLPEIQTESIIVKNNSLEEEE